MGEPDAEQLDWRSAEMLVAIDDNGGRASTSTIRSDTALDNNQVRYRREKLQDLGLIDVESGESPNDRPAPKIHVLTDDAAERLDTLVENADRPTPGTFDELADVVTNLRERMDRIERSIGDVEQELDSHRQAEKRRRKNAHDELRDDLEELQEQVNDLASKQRGGVF